MSVSRVRAISFVLLLGISAALLVTWSTHKTSQQRILESLVDYVVKNGQIGTVTAEGLEYFQLPTDDLRAKHVTIRTENGGSRSVQLLRKREIGQYNVFFVDVVNESTAYFYRASSRGELIKAAYLDPMPHEVADADERFRKLLEFWKGWQSEKLKGL